MPDFVPLGDEVNLEIDISGPGCESIKKFQFVFKRADGEQVATVNGDIDDKRMGSGTWEAAGVKDEEMNCRVLWEAKADDLPALGRGELIVYRNTLEVVTKDGDGQPVNKTMVHVAITPDPLYTEPCKTGSTRRTDEEGKVTFDDLPPGDVKVSIRTPFKLLEWVSETGPSREAKVDKSYSACFVWPDVKALGEDPHKQYVNLPVDTNHPEQGKVMKIKAKVDTATTPGGGITGDKIYLKVKWGDNNSDRNDPAPSIGDNVGGKGKGPFVVDAALTADGGEVEFELDLGVAGGDECEVWLGGDEACTDASFKLVNWRKLWIKPVKVPSYDLPNNQLPDDLKEQINDTLLPVFIECEFEDAYLLDHPSAFAVDQQRARELQMKNPENAPYCFFSNTCPEKSVLQDIANDNPLRLWWLLGNVLYETKTETFNIKMKGRTSGWQTSAEGNGFLPIEPDGSAVLLKWRAYKAPEYHKGSGKTRPAIPAQACYWSRDGEFDVGGEIDISCLDFHSSGQKFKVELPASTGIGRFTKVHCRVKLTTFSYTAGSSTNHWVTGTISKSKPLAGLYTILHELGHSLGHTASGNGSAPGLPEKHPNYYTGKGHQGSHCNYGLSTSNQAKDNYNPLVLKGKHGTCIMFGGIGPKTDYTKALKFCPKCEPYVKAMKMERL